MSAPKAKNPQKPPDAYGDFIAACTEMIGRIGAHAFELRYSEPDEGMEDDSPVVWIAIATFHGGVKKTPLGDVPFPTHTEAAGALLPSQAAFRLLEILVDGGTCTHCQRPTGISETIGEMPANNAFCWYQYDPELKTFRRSCEGD